MNERMQAATQSAIALQAEVAMRVLDKIPAESKSKDEAAARKAALVFLKDMLELRPGE